MLKATRICGNPRFLKGPLPKLRHHQRSLSRKIEAAKRHCEAAKAAGKQEDAASFKLRDFFGANLAREKKRVASSHESVRNARNDWQHKLSRQLADEKLKAAGLSVSAHGCHVSPSRKAVALADEVGSAGL
jgi:putative transposase